MTRRFVPAFFVVFALLILAVGGFRTYQRRQARLAATAADSFAQPDAPRIDAAVPVRLSPQARKNLGLVSKPLQLVTYWRKIELPGVVTEFPGVSDRGVVAPVTGVVTRIFAHPGETVAPDTPLFTLRLVSDTLHASQRQLFKATKEIEIARQQRERLSALAQSGALAQSRLIEIENQIQRAEVNVQAYRQDLVARGVPLERIEAAAQGEFATEIMVRAPPEQALKPLPIALASAESQEPKRLAFGFEFQELKVELGQQVEAGQALCNLADHRSLLVEGRGFTEDMPLIQQTAKNGLLIEIEFEQRGHGNWPPPPERLRIHHIENSVDRQTRTFAFDLVLENQWQTYDRDGEVRVLWRFRPGDRVRLLVAVERFDEVFVLPPAAVVREGSEAYVFRQNGDFFDRKPVHVLAEDRTHLVIANDGSVRPGFYVAQNAAASLNRVLKAQAASGMPANVHVHADGTVHEAH